MATENYVLLERIELNASAASITFNNIPQSGYTDLRLDFSVRTTRSDVAYDNLAMQFNGDSTSNAYTVLMAYGNGSSALAATDTNQYGSWQYASDALSTTNAFGSGSIYIPNYLGNQQKSYTTDSVSENNATLAISSLLAGRWTGTSAISSITLTDLSATIGQYSTFSLYGIAAVGTTPVIAPKATGGNIYNDGTYWIHSFLTSDTFTPFQTLSCDVLVIAGGGGGGGNSGGGGGAGGYRTASALSVNTATTVTVGAGGAFGAVAAQGTSGTNSIFSSITSTGGGYGGNSGSNAYPTGGAGGSGGGGGSGASSSTPAGGSGNTPSTSPSQGNNGGAGNYVFSQTVCGGGGGGAGGAGGNAVASGSTPGTAGAGVANSISGSSVTYATGGRGGGDAASAPSTNIANTGNGGYGGYWNGTSSQNAASGNSGIVIIRYAMA